MSESEILDNSFSSMSKGAGISLVGKSDLVWLTACGVGYLATSVIPQNLDSWCVSQIGSLFLVLRAKSVRKTARRIQSSLQLAEFDDALRIARDYYRIRADLHWGRARGLHKSGWQPEIELQGEHHLHQALKGGRGVIVWRMSFCDNPVFFQCLWRAGIPVVHLRGPTHGAPSRSRVGLRLTRRVYTRAEDLYLKEVVEMPLDPSLGYMRILLARLRQNACVSIVGENLGRQNIRAKLFTCTAEFATGAPSLAWRTGAVLLTSYTIRLNAFHYRVIIEDPIDLERSLGRRQFVEQAVGEFARRLEEHVTQHPANWQGWTGQIRSHVAFTDGLHVT